MKRLKGRLALAGALLALFGAQEAIASSFVKVAAPKGATASIVYLGEPALGDPPLVSAPPDISIETAALPDAERPEIVKGPPSAGSTGDVAWPPVLSTSMIALGTPVAPGPAVETREASAAPRAFSLPLVIRGGISGGAFPGGWDSGPAEEIALPEPARKPGKTLHEERREWHVRREMAREEGRAFDEPEPEAPKRPEAPAAPPPPPPPTQRLE